MNREHIEKLLGGYAAGILSEEEKRQLFAAALEDQALFDTLSREQALKEVLDDPASRSELQRALESPPQPARWKWWARPAFGLAATAALAGLVLVLVPKMDRHEPVMMVKVEPAPVPRMPEPAAPEPLKNSAPRVAPARPAPRRTEIGTRENERLFAPPPPPKSEPAEPAISPPPIVAQKTEVAPVPAPESRVSGLRASGGGAASAPPPARGPARYSFAETVNVDASARFLPQTAALPYQILKRNPDGQYILSPATVPFKSSDMLRFFVQPPENGSLRVERLDAGGSWQPVSTDNVQAGVPLATTQSFSPGAGQFRLTLVPARLSRMAVSAVTDDAQKVRSAQKPLIVDVNLKVE